MRVAKTHYLDPHTDAALCGRSAAVAMMTDKPAKVDCLRCASAMVGRSIQRAMATPEPAELPEPPMQRASPSTPADVKRELRAFHLDAITYHAAELRRLGRD